LDRSKDQKTAQRHRIGPARQTPESGKLGADEVAAYLRRHPDFLNERPELIASLTPPAMRRGESIVDMQHFMLQRLRAEVGKLKSQHRSLIATSRSNLMSQARIHAAVLAIIGARSFEQLIQVATTDLAVMLDVDVVTIGVESAAAAQPRLPLHGIQILRPGTVDRLLGNERDAVLSGDTVGDPVLFGSAAGLVRSQALLRLEVSEQAPVGLLCVGTRKPEKFHAGQGTELLTFLARALELAIAAWLDLAA
jgi:uncharacterized protein YigA (DUF484 family)